MATPPNRIPARRALRAGSPAGGVRPSESGFPNQMEAGS